MADVARMVAVLAILLLAASPGAHGSFACDGGSIPDAWVNDDYCDCADGLDEPRTGACPDTLFHCPCAPHRPKHVFASRVNDGVCDCCDGSDEWKSDTCPNTCVSLASTDLLRQAHASKLKRERELRGKEAAASRAEKLEKARAELATALPAFEAARAAKVAAEAVEAERKADRERRLAAGEVATALKVGELSGELLRVALARVAISLQVSGADALHDSLAASPSIGQAMDDVDSADLIEVAMEAKDAASAYDSDGPQSAAAQGAPQSCESAAAACGFEVDLLKLLPLDAMPLDELRSLVRGFAEEHGQITLLARVSAALLRGAGVSLDEAAVAAALTLLEPFKDVAADEARAALAALDGSPSRHKVTIDQLERVEAIRADFGEDFEWFALYDSCYTARHGSFEYRLCPFDTFSQDSRSLGKYTGWAQQGAGDARERTMEMMFANGESCGATPRSARVSFTCGEEDKLLTVEEPSTCTYTATFRTPSACSTELVRKLHLELAAAAAGQGLPYEPDQTVKTVLGL